ncbi:MAG: hypothetical protein K0R69_1367 [Clostridia bacterium]|jgi:hypothetical protein|nr:hypothetical protein [Clostridia bacterium]
MNEGQALFNDFFIERVKEDKKEEAKLLLEDSFARQAAGTFDKAYFQEIMPKFFAILKPEAVEEVKAAMDHFASRL